MNRAFNQQVDCKYGIKPYYEAADSGSWIASFDGDNFTLRSANGARQFGGTFQNSGNAIERENFATAALYRTYLGTTGGEIYFTKTISEQIIAAGHNNFGGNNARADTVECGEGTETAWIARPAQTPITATDSAIAFGNGSIEMNCALRQGDGPFNEPRQMRAITTQDGALSMLVGGRDYLFQIPNFNAADRTVTMPISSGKLSPGGIRVYQSTEASGDKVEINLRYDNLVRHIRETKANGQLVNCVPNPLEPRY